MKFLPILHSFILCACLLPPALAQTYESDCEALLMAVESHESLSGDDAAYLNLIERLSETGAISPEALRVLSQADRPTNPLSSENENLSPESAHVYRLALSRLIQRGRIDWQNLRPFFDRLIAKAHEQGAKRQTAKSDTEYVATPILRKEFKNLISQVPQGRQLIGDGEMHVRQSNTGAMAAFFPIKTDRAQLTYVLNLSNGKFLPLEEAPSTWALSNSVTVGGRTFLAEDSLAQIRIYDLETGKIVSRVQSPFRQADVCVYGHGFGAHKALLARPDGSLALLLVAKTGDAFYVPVNGDKPIEMSANPDLGTFRIANDSQTAFSAVFPIREDSKSYLVISELGADGRKPLASIEIEERRSGDSRERLFSTYVAADGKRYAAFQDVRFLYLFDLSNGTHRRVPFSSPHVADGRRAYEGWFVERTPGDVLFVPYPYWDSYALAQHLQLKSFHIRDQSRDTDVRSNGMDLSDVRTIWRLGSSRSVVNGKAIVVADSYDHQFNMSHAVIDLFTGESLPVAVKWLPDDNRVQRVILKAADGTIHALLFGTKDVRDYQIYGPIRKTD